MLRVSLLFLLLLLMTSSSVSQEMPEYQDLYCGDKNCYDLLGVTRDSTKGEISKSYRKLALQWHPDKFRDEVLGKWMEGIICTVV